VNDDIVVASGTRTWLATREIILWLRAGPAASAGPGATDDGGGGGAD